MIEHGDEVQRVLEGSSISLCLDTGHLLIGGTDPAELTRQVPHRIAHTHMKDVDLGLARQVQSGRRTYTEAVRDGMYRPLGDGDVDVDVAAIVGTCAGRATTAGTSSSRTPSSPRNPEVRARWPTCTPVPRTCRG